MIPQTASVNGALQQVNLVGAPVGSVPLQQPLTAGHQVAGPGQAVVDSRLGVGWGPTWPSAGTPFLVVGTTSDRTLLGGIPDLYVDPPRRPGGGLRGGRGSSVPSW